MTWPSDTTAFLGILDALHVYAQAAGALSAGQTV